jgi:hypothetical protein
LRRNARLTADWLQPMTAAIAAWVVPPTRSAAKLAAPLKREILIHLNAREGGLDRLTGRCRAG